MVDWYRYFTKKSKLSNQVQPKNTFICESPSLAKLLPITVLSFSSKYQSIKKNYSKGATILYEIKFLMQEEVFPILDHIVTDTLDKDNKVSVVLELFGSNLLFCNKSIKKSYQMKLVNKKEILFKRYLLF